MQKILIRGRNGLRRVWYRQRVRFGLVPDRPEFSAEDFARLKSVCVFLGPYRNLTTLTAALLSLHPRCQVLNHGGFRILEEDQLNFLKNSSRSVFRKFLQYVVTESQGGAPGDEGGSITLSHAFRSERMREAYGARFGAELCKANAECFVWKDSLAVTNYLRAENLSLDEILTHNPYVRFLLPIRHPIDCALSNVRTGHGKRFERAESRDSCSVLRAVVGEIAWFHRVSRAHPDRCFSFCQYELDAALLAGLADFLAIEADQRWIADALKCYDLKPSYDHAPELVAEFRRLVDEHFADDTEFASRLRMFLPS